jgi:hypothetical protein
MGRHVKACEGKGKQASKPILAKNGTFQNFCRLLRAFWQPRGRQTMLGEGRKD